MASQSTGIQQLLVAEKRAAEKVSEARKRKARRLKQAKEEAQTEIEKYKKQRENTYKEHESQILGTKGDMEQKIAVTTEQTIRELDSGILENKERAMSRLLSLVIDVQPELHKNLKV